MHVSVCVYLWYSRTRGRRQKSHPHGILHVHVCVCISHQQQQKHHVRVVAHTRYMQSCPQVLVLQVDI